MLVKHPTERPFTASAYSEMVEPACGEEGEEGEP
jgi:hypothetical protein